MIRTSRRSHRVRRYESFGDVYAQNRNWKTEFTVDVSGGVVYGSQIKGAKKDPMNTTTYGRYDDVERLLKNADQVIELGSLDALLKNKKAIVSMVDGSKCLLLNGFAFDVKDLKKVASKFEHPVTNVYFCCISREKLYLVPDGWYKVYAYLLLESDTNVAYYQGVPFLDEDMKNLQEIAGMRILNAVFGGSSAPKAKSPKHDIPFSLDIQGYASSVSGSNALPDISFWSCEEVMDGVLYDDTISSAIFQIEKYGKSLEQLLSDEFSFKRGHDDLRLHQVLVSLDGDTEEDMIQDLRRHVELIGNTIDYAYDRIMDELQKRDVPSHERRLRQRNHAFRKIQNR